MKILKNIFSKASGPAVMETQLFPDSDWLDYYISFVAEKSWTGRWSVYECLYVQHGRRLAFGHAGSDLEISKTPVELPALKEGKDGVFFQLKIKSSVATLKTAEEAKAFLAEREAELATSVAKGRMHETALAKVTSIPARHFKNL